MRLLRLKNRADFLRAQKGVRRVQPGLTLEMCPTPAEAAGNSARIGFTATKKLGNAVTRNRAKRRLRAAAAQLLPLYGQPGNDYVLVARAGTLTLPFAGLLEHLGAALSAVHARQGRQPQGLRP